MKLNLNLKSVDGLLNIVVVAVIGLWLLGKLMGAGEAPPVTLEEEAGQAFEEPAESIEPLTDIIATEPRPVLLLVFASWCPHCKRLYPELAELAVEEQDKLRVVALSSDQHPGALEAFLNRQAATPVFPVYHLGRDGEALGFDQMRRTYHLQYHRAIPYMALFTKGRLVAELAGYQPKERLRGLILDASRYRIHELKQFEEEGASEMP